MDKVLKLILEELHEYGESTIQSLAEAPYRWESAGWIQTVPSENQMKTNLAALEREGYIVLTDEFQSDLTGKTKVYAISTLGIEKINNLKQCEAEQLRWPLPLKSSPKF